MRPPPPAWFSMMTGWPRIACRRAVTSRDTASVDPPGGTGRTSLMVRSGKVWAGAAVVLARTTAAAAMHKRGPGARMAAILRRAGSRQQRVEALGLARYVPGDIDGQRSHRGGPHEPPDRD